MTPDFVPLSQATPQPWRNGGGVTRELLAWPQAGAVTGDRWSVRVSVADITQDGPFSLFPGIERCFAVLEGAGVELTLWDRALRLTPGDAPLHFDGAAAPGCRLLGGPTRDLNLMVRAEAGPAGMAQAQPGVRWTTGARWRGIYVHGPSVVEVGSGTLNLPSAGLAWATTPAEGGRSPGTPAPPLTWTVLEGGPAWWLWAPLTETST